MFSAGPDSPGNCCGLGSSQLISVSAQNAGGAGSSPRAVLLSTPLHRKRRTK
jgi:hypothetical protein